MVMNVEYDIIHLSPIGQNRKAYPREDKTCGDDSSISLIDYRKWCYTFIAANTDLIRNNIPENRYLVLYHLLIGGEKYSI